MNSLNLVGRLTKDPELREVNVGGDSRSVCDMRIAVDGRRGDPLYLDIATWGKQAEACAEHLTKGRQVAFTGELMLRQSEKDGEKRSFYSGVGHVEFLSGKPAGGDADQPGEEA
jgi:single-strand DNA-binding protein